MVSEDANQYPLFPAAHKKAPRTSHDAAKKAAPRNRSAQARLAKILKVAAMTPEEAAQVLNLDLFTIRPAFSMLRKQGKIEDSGRRGESRTGRKAVAWRWVDGA